MKRKLLQLVSATVNKYLRSIFPPNGQPTLYHWEAECNAIIDGIDDTLVPLSGTETITPTVFVKVFDWLLTQVVAANDRSWSVKCLCQMMSVEVHRNANEVLQIIKEPPNPVGLNRPHQQPQHQEPNAP